jgi:hypothetical protein
MALQTNIWVHNEVDHYGLEKIPIENYLMQMFQHRRRADFRVEVKNSCGDVMYVLMAEQHQEAQFSFRAPRRMTEVRLCSRAFDFPDRDNVFTG